MTSKEKSDEIAANAMEQTKAFVASVANAERFIMQNARSIANDAGQAKVLRQQVDEALVELLTSQSYGLVDEDLREAARERFEAAWIKADSIGGVNELWAGVIGSASYPNMRVKISSDHSLMTVSMKDERNEDEIKDSGESMFNQAAQTLIDVGASAFCVAHGTKVLVEFDYAAMQAAFFTFAIGAVFASDGNDIKFTLVI